jgi:hypothetical protein
VVNNERDDARDDAGEAEEQKPSDPKPRVRPEDPALEEIASLGAYAADTPQTKENGAAPEKASDPAAASPETTGDESGASEAASPKEDSDTPLDEADEMSPEPEEDPSPVSDSEPDTEFDPELDPEPSAESDSELDPEAVSEPETEPDTELDTEPTSEPTPEPAAPPRKEVVVRQEGLKGGLIGGAIAVAVGFAVAQVTMDGTSKETVAALSASVTAQSEQLNELAAQVAEMPAGGASSGPAPDRQQFANVERLAAELQAGLAALEEARAGISATRDDLNARMEAFAADVTARLAEVEIPTVDLGAADAAISGAVQAYKDEVAALRDETRARFEALSADVQSQLGAGSAAIVEALEANQRLEEERAAREAAAQAAEAAAQRAVALSQLQIALENGAPFADALAQLPDVPAPLPDLAESGVPTQADLEEAFPPLAREALSNALRSADTSGAESRISAFLRTQLGMRSLVPKEGDDPDAVLSRIEAAVSAGDLTAAVETAGTLPDSAKAVLADWVALVEKRNSALTAAAALADSLNTN